MEREKTYANRESEWKERDGSRDKLILPNPSERNEILTISIRERLKMRGKI